MNHFFIHQRFKYSALAAIGFFFRRRGGTGIGQVGRGVIHSDQLRIERRAADTENVIDRHCHDYSPRNALRMLDTRFSRKDKVA